MDGLHSQCDGHVDLQRAMSHEGTPGRELQKHAQHRALGHIEAFAEHFAPPLDERARSSVRTRLPQVALMTVA